ncbi:CaiB/BaiF CoA transferase family protein [Streptomyces spongiae]|uniref:CoA transferase n=1 Tax=Streptomyces spongiae TaxID=565072 RepID=A0A5N8XHU6_9ACTN|nr:CaiB/BaiF CoA-transferase family protein [Streptomyces spongiae]MPY59050.1 CoA transferase [Streptomyces spongiae]
MTAGPLAGLRVVEFAGIGPGPHAAMLLADLGAEVIRLQRDSNDDSPDGITTQDVIVRRGRLTVPTDLKDPDDLAFVRRLLSMADVAIEGYRPGVLERLGLGPADLLEDNPRLVVARLTGWGQDGPEAHVAGHDLNYLAATGVLDAIGRPGQMPVPPLNLVADFGGGSMFALFGILSAIVERERSGRGQVIDVSMAEGTLTLSAMVWSWRAAGRWPGSRGTNILDGGAPFYDTYPCSDGGLMAIGALEPKFFDLALKGLGLDPRELPAQYDRAGWPRLRRAIATAFASRTRAEWAAVFEGSDACVTPVLSFDEAVDHPHLAHRSAFVSVGGLTQPAASPRFSRTPPPAPAPETFGELEDVVDRWAAADTSANGVRAS